MWFADDPCAVIPVVGHVSRGATGSAHTNDVLRNETAKIETAPLADNRFAYGLKRARCWLTRVPVSRLDRRPTPSATNTPSAV